MNNAEIDSLVENISSTGATKYVLLGKLAEAMSLSLCIDSEKSVVLKALANSRKRLQRQGKSVTIIPVWLSAVKHPTQANKAFIEMCEDIYWNIEHKISSYIENNYSKDNRPLHLHKALRREISKATGFTPTNIEAYFEHHVSAVELLEANRGNDSEALTTQQEENKHTTVVRMYYQQNSLDEISLATAIPVPTISRWVSSIPKQQTIDKHGKMVLNKTDVTEECCVTDVFEETIIPY